MRTAKANHQIFENAELDFEQFGIETVEISLGINSAFSRQLVGTGDVPCYCVGQDGDGKTPGLANTPGFVVNLHADDLEGLGFSCDEIAFALGARRGYYLDGDKPCCGECLVACGYGFEDLGEDLEHAKQNPKQDQACEYCAEMIFDDLYRNQSIN